MKIFSAKNPTEAHIVCELLRSENIASEVRGEGIFGLKGELPLTEDTDPYIWLFHSEQSAKAKNLITEYEKQSDIKQEDWICSGCGESNESQFGACWQCGLTAP